MNRRALILGTDEPLRTLISAVLARQGLRLSTADEAADDGFDVVVIDGDRPHASDLLRQLRGSGKCLVIGAADSELVRKVGGDPAFCILRKPFGVRELESAVEACLGPEQIQLQCLSCEREQEFTAASETAARELARSLGWRIVTFVRDENCSFVTVCPHCAGHRLREV